MYSVFITLFLGCSTSKRTTSRRGATYTLDKNGDPVWPRYRPRTEADDTIRLPPVVVGTRVAAPVVKQITRDSRVFGVDMHNEKTTMHISKETQDRYNAIREQYRLEEDMAELQNEMRKREEAEAKLVAREFQRERKKTLGTKKAECDTSIKSANIADIMPSPTRHISPSNTSDDENIDDIINELLAPEPPRSLRHNKVKHAPTTDSLPTHHGDVETPTTTAPAVVIKDDDHESKLADFYDSLKAIEEWKKRFALATFRVYNKALNETTSTEHKLIVECATKPVSKENASVDATNISKEVSHETAIKQISANSENSKLSIKEFTLVEALKAIHPSETPVKENAEEIDVSLDDEPKSPIPDVEVKKISSCRRIWKNVKKFLCCCG